MWLATWPGVVDGRVGVVVAWFGGDGFGHRRGFGEAGMLVPDAESGMGRRVAGGGL